jgi:ParB-like chromosome segregation protein Spo0J
MATRKKTQAAPTWPASEIVQRPIDAITPYARNARTHSPEQVAQIAASIREWGWTNPVLITEDGTIIAGHGRVLAARQLGIAEIPCIVARGWSEAQMRAYVLADNQLALNAGWNEEMVALELADIAAAGFDLGLIGFDAAALEDFGLGRGEDDEKPSETTDIGGDRFLVLVECADEPGQQALFEELTQRGLACKIS